jgi:hypothetical protein
VDEEEDDRDDDPEDREGDEDATEGLPEGREIIAEGWQLWRFGRNAGVLPLRLALLAQGQNDTFKSL